MELIVSGDLLDDLGPLFLGSRLKRLAERLQSGAGRVIEQAGLPVQPSQMPLLAALDGGAMTISQLVEAVGFSQPGVTRSIGQLVALGLVKAEAGRDQRQRSISLTPAGEAAMARAKLHVWPAVTQAMEAICADLSGPFLTQVTALEAALAEQPLDARAAALGGPELTIRDFDDSLAGTFHDINAEWIEAMFRMEETDRDVLQNPRERIVDAGGAILFVEAGPLGIVGTCALRPTGGGGVELTKMGVRPAARGLKAGEFLLAAAIERARLLGADPLYLLTSARCAPAIHLYEKLGFRHDVEIMARYGSGYERCNVAMRYRPG